MKKHSPFHLGKEQEGHLWCIEGYSTFPLGFLLFLNSVKMALKTSLTSRKIHQGSGSAQ